MQAPSKRLIALLATGGIALGCSSSSSASRASGPKSAASPVVAASPERGAEALTVSPVVAAPWVATQGAAVQILDVRPAADFERGHVPGAARLDPSTLRARVDGVAGQVAPIAALASALGHAGLTRDLPIVVVGARVETESARAFWTLEYIGHPVVHYLDGGFAAYARAHLPEESGPSTRVESVYAPRNVRESLRVDADDVARAIGTIGLVDARTTEEFRSGHIASAVNVDWNTQVTDEGALRSRASLEAPFASVPPGGSWIAYCQSGSRASVAYLVLRHLGHSVTLYDGSWAEWSTLDPARYPRATGE